MRRNGPRFSPPFASTMRSVNSERLCISSPLRFFIIIFEYFFFLLMYILFCQSRSEGIALAAGQFTTLRADFFKARNLLGPCRAENWENRSVVSDSCRWFVQLAHIIIYSENRNRSYITVLLKVMTCQRILGELLSLQFINYQTFLIIICNCYWY